MTTRKPEESRHGAADTIHEQYRKVLGQPDLTDHEIAEMRRHVIEFARTVCEHAWGKRFY
jgi:hypothetical protein